MIVLSWQAFLGNSVLDMIPMPVVFYMTQWRLAISGRLHRYGNDVYMSRPHSDRTEAVQEQTGIWRSYRGHRPNECLVGGTCGLLYALYGVSGNYTSHRPVGTSVFSHEPPSSNNLDRTFKQVAMGRRALNAVGVAAALIQAPADSFLGPEVRRPHVPGQSGSVLGSLRYEVGERQSTRSGLQTSRTACRPGLAWRRACGVPGGHGLSRGDEGCRRGDAKMCRSVITSSVMILRYSSRGALLR